MKDLSVAQEYLLCSLNDKGKFSTFNSKLPVAFVAGAILELLLNDCIKIEKKKLLVIGQLPQNCWYLQSLFEWLNEAAPKSIEKVVGQYALSFTNKRMNLLLDQVGSSLEETGSVTRIEGRKPAFLPNTSAVDHVIQKIRAELLEPAPLSDEMVALVSLMDKAGQIKQFFSSYEANLLKKRLQEIRQSDSSKLVKQMVEYVDIMMIIIAST